MATAIPLALDDRGRQLEEENYYIIAVWEYGNQKTDTRKVAVTISCVMRNAHYVDESKKIV